MKNIYMMLLLILFTSSLVMAGTINITSPGPGAKWTKGISKPISWNGSGFSGQIKISLWKGGVNMGTIAKNQPQSGTFMWNVGSYLGGSAPVASGYQIKLRVQGGDPSTPDAISPHFDIKNQFLMIKPETLKVINPKLQINPQLLEKLKQLKPDLKPFVTMQLNKARFEPPLISKFYVRVKNVGPGNCTSPSVLRVKILQKYQGAYKDFEYFPHNNSALAAGAEETKTINYHFKAPGQYKICVWVDDLNAVTEVNESNNDICIEFQIVAF